MNGLLCESRRNPRRSTPAGLAGFGPWGVTGLGIVRSVL